MNTLIDTFIQMNPSLKRSDADLDEDKKKNIFTNEVYHIKKDDPPRPSLFQQEPVPQPRSMFGGYSGNNANHFYGGNP